MGRCPKIGEVEMNISDIIEPKPSEELIIKEDIKIENMIYEIRGK